MFYIVSLVDHLNSGIIDIKDGIRHAEGRVSYENLYIYFLKQPAIFT